MNHSRFNTLQMQVIVELLLQYGAALVFLCVLVEQTGFPLPAYPVLMVAGSLAFEGKIELGSVALAAIVACLLADALWYALGARLGTRVLNVLCRVSMSAEVCIRQTQNMFKRWGAPSLIFAKFVPGFASLATAMAGSTGTRRMSFAAFDIAGSALWSGSALAVGWVFGPAVQEALAMVANLGSGALLALTAAAALVFGSKLLTRRKYAAAVARTGISVDALRKHMREGTGTVVDARSRLNIGEARIPGAIHFNELTFAVDFAGVPTHALVVVYCDCPHDASAVAVARKLKARGYRFVHPLRGGFSAWSASSALF